MPTARQAFLLRRYKRSKNALDRREYADDVSMYKTLTTTPTPAAGPFTLPARGRLAVSHATGVTAGQLTVVINGTRTMKTPALAANQIWRLDTFGRHAKITCASTAPGVVKIYILDEWARPKLIAQGTF